MSPQAQRARVLLRAARDFLKKLNAEGDDAIATLTYFDEADCDGQCLLDDLNDHLGLSASIPALQGTWQVTVEHPGQVDRDRTFHVQDQAIRYRDEMQREGFTVTVTPEV